MLQVKRVLSSCKANSIKAAAFFPVGKKYYCSICGRNYPFFQSAGNHSLTYKRKNIVGGGFRKNVKCPVCGSIDRDRWVDYVIEHYTGYYKKELKVLHIAPEQAIERKLRKNKRLDYITGDIRKGVGDIVVNIEKTEFPDKTFDVIILNHILAHVVDDKKALRELWRILKVGGCLFVSTPICLTANTYENKAITTDEAREFEYGEFDYQRLYGKDFIEYLSGFGYEVEEFNVQDKLSEEDIRRMRLMSNDRIYLARKGNI